MKPIPLLDLCCSPVLADRLDRESATRLAGAFGALADPARLRLLSMIAASEGQEACVCDLTAPVGLSQPTVSHHLKVLLEAGLVRREQRGRWAYYRVVPERLDALREALATRAPVTA
jgi:ArsR family transcriptional regulator